MKKLLILSLLSMGMAGCSDLNHPHHEKYGTAIVLNADSTMNQTVLEYEYDGCQYVYFGTGQWAWGGHKGNCKNPIHRVFTDSTQLKDRK